MNVFNSNTRWSFPEINHQEAPSILMVRDTRDIWKKPERSSSVLSVQNEHSLTSRPSRNWQLLANDPQDNDSPYDTENIYYEITETSLNFKYQYYEPWEDPYENTVAVLYINVDSNSETGTTMFNYADYSELAGIDMLIYSFGDDEIDGVYVYSEDNNYYYGGGFIKVNDLLWFDREPNTNEFSFGFSNEYFEGLVSMQVASISGSFLYPPDAVPNEGMAELTFRPSWLSVTPEEGEVLSGELLNLDVTFDAEGLFGGDYHSVIEVTTNDPETVIVEVPVHLNVTGIPIIDYPTEIYFGEVYVGYPDTIEYVIANVGTDLLLIENITFQDMWLSTEQENLLIGPLEEESLHLIAEINNPETFVTIMSFTTNDLQNDVVENIMVGATAINPPVMNVSQSEFIFAHSSESSEINELIITNTGGSSLAWQMEFESINGPSDEWFFFEKTDFSDFTSGENQDRITDNVWITRENSGPIFNYYLENVPEYGCNSQTPSGTLWSSIPREESNTNDYVPFIQMTGCCPPCIVGDTVSVWLIQEDLKLNVVFDSWTSGGQGGGFSYYREQAIPQWIEILPMEGVVGVDESQEVFISVNSFGLDEGEHSTVLLLTSNDPEAHSMSMPVDLVYMLNNEGEQLPISYALYPTYPNPFNPSTTIHFDVPETLNNNITLNVFDIRGRLVETILDKELTAGSYAIRWDAKSKPSGVYFLRMDAEKYTKTHKMVLMK